MPPDALALVRPAPWPAALRRLRAAAAQRLQRPLDRVARVAVPAPAADPLAWLAGQAEPGAYWRGRDGHAWAALGEADGLDALDRLETARAALPPGARYVGWHAFAEEAPWDDVPPVRFWLPRVTFQRADAAGELAVHLVPGDTTRSLDDALAALRPPAETGPVPPPAGRERTPDEAGWDALVHDALGAIASGALDKLVPARRTRYRFEAAPEAAALAAALYAASPHAYHFALPTGAGTFLGASPERLVRLDGRALATESLAGTGHGASRLESDKNRREQQVVTDAIRHALAPLATALEVGDAAEVASARLRHLSSPVTATLRPEVGVAAVLRALHPTPAVGGWPQRPAVAWLRAREPFARGLYAGFVGWAGADAAEFAVAIRCGHLRCGRLDCYTGAGVVPGSDAAAEWAETEAKLGAFAAALGLEA